MTSAIRTLLLLGAWVGCGIHDGETKTTDTEPRQRAIAMQIVELELGSTKDFAVAEARVRELVRAGSELRLEITLTSGTYSGRRLRLDGRKVLHIDVRAQGEVILENASMDLVGRSVAVHGVRFRGSDRREVRVIQIHAEESVTLQDLHMQALAAGSSSAVPSGTKLQDASRGAQTVRGALIYARLTHKGRVRVQDIHVQGARVPGGSLLSVHSGYPADVVIQGLRVVDTQVQDVLYLPGVGSLDLSRSQIDLDKGGELMAEFSGTYRLDGELQ